MAKLDLTDPKFDALKAHIGNRAAAATQHGLDLGAEIAAHDGSHSFGRHGYQTGWEAQLIRCCTLVTPEQPFDLSGSNATIRQWNSNFAFTMDMDLIEVGVFMDAHGARQEGALVAEAPHVYQKKPGQIAGGFLGPEQQQEALRKARAAAAVAAQYVAGRFAFTTRPALKPITMPLTSLCAVVSSDKAGFGLGFRRLAGRPWHAVTRDQVLDLLNALSPAADRPRKTWDQIFPGRTASINKFHVKNQAATFTSPADLFDFLNVEAFWQKTARVIMRRTYDKVSKTYGAWGLVTAFPDSVVLPGAVPFEFTLDMWLTPEQKAMLKKKKLPIGGGKKEYWAWTGDVATGLLSQPDKLVWTKRALPAWA